MWETPFCLLQCVFSYYYNKTPGTVILSPVFLSSYEGGLVHEQLFKLVSLWEDDPDDRFNHQCLTQPPSCSQSPSFTSLIVDSVT